jgi:glycosyltransferase involved in cell wall biosynthesis
LKKTKIFIDIFYYKTALSGIKTYIEELLSAVKDHGSNEVDYVISHDISKMDNNQFFINSKFRLVRWIFQLRYLIWKQLFLPIILYKKKIDYLICPDYVAPILSPSKKIVVIHDNLFWKYPQNYPRLWRKYFIGLIKAGIDKKTQIVTTSNYSKDGLSDFFKKNSIKSIYQSSEDTSSNVNTNNKKYITHIGTFERRKDLLTLVKAYKKIIDNGHCKYDLVLAGSTFINGSHKVYNEIINYINEHGLEKKVIIPGYISKNEILKLYSESIVYVFPSIDEGFGIPLIEAMKSGVPVICSDIEIFKEIGRDSVLYFKVGDENDLFEKLRTLLNNEELRKDLINSGKQNIKRFNRKNFIKEFEKIYK